MRDFLDAILSFIACSTLSDDEWATIDTLTDQSYTLANYNALLGILIARESVSNATDRLKKYFQSAGVTITEEPVLAKSNIYLGDAL